MSESSMRTMVLHAQGERLTAERWPIPEPGPGQIRLRVTACAVCRTDLHVIDGDLPDPTLPLVPGHEIVGTVDATGPGSERYQVGNRVGVPWLGYVCGECRYCREGQENLCDAARFTGYQIQGGYAEYTVADERFCFPIPDTYGDAEATPLLCAGLIGQRALRMAGDGEAIGLYGFGAAAHIIAQIAIHQGRRVLALTRPGDTLAQNFARRLGAVWAGDSTEPPPEPLDAAVIFAPVGSLVPAALRAARKGGRVVCAGIHMSEIPAFPYRILWEERSIHSVANLTRADGDELMRIAPEVPVTTHIRTYPLEEANAALDDLREGRLEGAAVLVP
ncbi:zinc-dependent alcohol dehydrogenase family protein [Arhodomonas sp. SL1]|uniref:zinc-dependent alcohol dehydrogenase family protein n=1 Tax=Arhodomonas sp. SL1 TaxID=3425691 RepID=UPI003F884CAC